MPDRNPSSATPARNSVGLRETLMSAMLLYYLMQLAKLLGQMTE
jgi:hypothetical protein